MPDLNNASESTSSRATDASEPTKFGSRGANDNRKEARFAQGVRDARAAARHARDEAREFGHLASREAKNGAGRAVHAADLALDAGLRRALDLKPVRWTRDHPQRAKAAALGAGVGFLLGGGSAGVATGALGGSTGPSEAPLLKPSSLQESASPSPSPSPSSSPSSAEREFVVPDRAVQIPHMQRRASSELTFAF